MTEAKRPNWEIVKEKAQAVSAYPEKFRVRAMIRQTVPAIMKGKKVDPVLLRESLKKPEGKVAEVVNNSRQLIEGGQNVDQFAMLVAIGLNALALEQSFIVPSVSRKK